MSHAGIVVRSILPAVLALLLGVAASLKLAEVDNARRTSEEQVRLVAELALVRARLEGILNATISSTDGLVNLVALQGGIAQETFDALARQAILKNPHIRNITLAPDDTIRMVYPLAGNERVIGFRYATNAEQYATVNLARLRQASVLAGPLELVQGGQGLVNRTPIFVLGKTGYGTKHYWGTASVVTRLDRLLDASEFFNTSEDIRIALRGKDGKGMAGDVFAGDKAVFDSQPVLMDVDVPGGTWLLGAIPAGGWQRIAYLDSEYFRFGLAISLLASFLIALKLSNAQQARLRNADLEREIRERQKIENALREEENRFRTLFDSSPDPAWIIENNRFIACNVAAAHMLGYADGTAVMFVHPSRLSPEFQPDGEDSFAKAERMMRIAREEGVHRFEWIHTRADGSEFPAEVTLSTVPQHGRQVLYCTWRDISARKRDEDRLKLAATVLASTSEGVVITDAAARIVSVNRAFSEITGYAEDEVVGLNPSFLQSERQPPEFYKGMWQILREKDVWQGEIWNRRKNGEIYPEWLAISAIRDDKGEITHYVGVFTDISTLKHSQDKLERMAHFDPLTDLPNRVLFQDRLAHAIDRANRYNHGIAVLLLDLDGFKTVNDSLGHPVGDRLLVEVAQRLKTCIRVEDTVARLGGDEFAVILVNMQDGADAIEVVRKLIASIEKPFDLDGHGAMISASVGIAIYPTDGTTPTELVRNADAAMYGAKDGGRNTYRFYQATMTHNAQERLHREAALRRGIENREFEVWFQPQIELRTGRLTGAEALVRWRDPQAGLVPPGDFIPLAERTGLILPLGELILHQVCSQARHWLDAGLNFGRLAINVAMPQIERSDYVETLKRMIEEFRLPPECLEIEITESLILQSAVNAREVLSRIQKLGITTSVDDFGTGYSSLAYLKELPIDNLKIDRAFVKDLPQDPNDIAITRAIIGMGHSLGFKIIAEGIETEEQLKFLMHEGCDEGQGYHFSKPLSPVDFIAWLQATR